MQKKTPDSTLTVLVPDHKEIRIGTLLRFRSRRWHDLDERHELERGLLARA